MMMRWLSVTFHSLQDDNSWIGTISAGHFFERITSTFKRNASPLRSKYSQPVFSGMPGTLLKHWDLEAFAAVALVLQLEQLDAHY